jgi:glycosyltransferase involved in cell wall biosynthesis
LFWCDVFVFHGTSSFFHGTSSFFEMYDLPILKLFGKRIIWIFHGSDSRPSYISGSSISEDYGCSIEKCIGTAKKQKKWVKRIERYADVIISHPPSSQFHEKKFIQYLIVGNPFKCKLEKENYANLLTDSGKLRIVHAPSFSECKGSSRFREIMKRMREKGYSFEFIEIVGRPNSEVLIELANCDFVIDELYSDTTMAGLATEAAFFGKPSVVGGYATIEDMGQLNETFIPPSEYRHPDEIEDAIEKLLTDEKYRLELGKKAGDFVSENWAPKKVAERFLRIVNDDYPEEWLYDPKDIRYLHGWGLPEDNVKDLIRRSLEYAGKDGLCLSDKPELEQKFIEFACNENR